MGKAQGEGRREGRRDGRKERSTSLNLRQGSDQTQDATGKFEWPEKMLSFSRMIPF